MSRVIKSRQTLHIADFQADPSYLERDPVAVVGVELGGIRTLVLVPMLKDDELVGAIAIFRQEVRPFTDKQIELVQNFAAQAVIAIENARLLNELRQRTDDLSESLEQQTATSEVLKVISSSPGELEPVFQAMLENATRICEAKFGTLFRYDGDAFRAAPCYGAPAALVEASAARTALRPGRQASSGRVAANQRGGSYRRPRCRSEVGAHARPELGGAAIASSCVPMLKDNELVGAIVIYRQEVRPFTDKQIELVQNFAAQAVIAIENTRLLNELREVARSSRPPPPTCSRSSAVRPFDLRAGARTRWSNRRPSSATQIQASIRRREGDSYPLAATFGLTAEQRDHFAQYSAQPDRGSVFGRTILDRRTTHVPDVVDRSRIQPASAARVCQRASRCLVCR